MNVQNVIIIFDSMMITISYVVKIFKSSDSRKMYSVDKFFKISQDLFKDRKEKKKLSKGIRITFPNI